MAAFLLFLAMAIFLRSKAPPEAARLLPESNCILSLPFNSIQLAGAIAATMHTLATSNDVRIDAWRFHENYDHARR